MFLTLESVEVLFISVHTLKKDFLMRTKRLQADLGQVNLALGLAAFQLSTTMEVLMSLRKCSKQVSLFVVVVLEMSLNVVYIIFHFISNV